MKHCYLHGIVTCPYFLGPENGVRFFSRFSFRCGIGCIFVALFVKSSFGHVWSMYRSSPFRSSLNTSYITSLDMCEVCTEAVKSKAPWTRVTSQVWTCVKYVPKQSILKHLEHELHHRFGHVWSMYRSSPFRSTLNTSYITGLDMCEVCT